MQKLPKVLFFDVNETLLDLSPLKNDVAELLRGKTELVSLWFTTLLHYSLVTSASGKYVHFGKIGAATLQMVAANAGISVSKEEAERVVVKGFRKLPAYPEVKEALNRLKSEGFTLVAFTNSDSKGLKAQLAYAGLTECFDQMRSMEEVGVYKPFTQTYNWGIQQLKIEPDDAMLVAAHGWDVAGAQWAGWQAAFIQRPGQQQFPLAEPTTMVATDLADFAAQLIARVM
ncbi:haloacid dehalogenase type II [Croceivirga sp. JEA036]|uniref:haloacid dehalogenase type II n=1 Tax=Croceivirga sp. JEA036 TaxID=2721162 RepID=UPI0014395A12|nr:haloacid dehalogenase type II [Croceivirga sp. JEA036]NJB36520.1 haloacid dehalogenase type II [Croceivirga sp. JEA036]